MRISFFASLFLLFSCGAENNTNKQTCEVSGTQINCTDGTIVDIPVGVDGKDGKNGKNGIDGKDGKDGEDTTDLYPIRVFEGVITANEYNAPDYEGPQGYQIVKIARYDYKEIFKDLEPQDSCNGDEQFKIKYTHAFLDVPVVISIDAFPVGNYCIKVDDEYQSARDINDLGYKNLALISNSKVEYEGISIDMQPDLFLWDYIWVSEEEFNSRCCNLK